VEINVGSFSNDVLKSIGIERANLKQLQTIKYLHEMEIKVDWHILCSISNSTTPDYYGTAGYFSSMHHLPPPQGIASVRNIRKEYQPVSTHHRTSFNSLRVIYDRDDEPELHGTRDAFEESIAQWKRMYLPWKLTYSCGPGFVRIFDRRGGEGELTYITLNSLQAAVFFFSEESRSVEQIAKVAPGVPRDRLQRFLNSLVKRRIMCRTSDDYYQSLPVHRKFEEIWVLG
jgi:hypothetical protein